ncbi:MAG TPA: proline--tRNA ligase [Mycobacteriales bacterium]|nr:proline--tRNA ligase [Mycobacteriales bacterium]
MVTRMSATLHRTLREDPADADVPSHRLLIRAGYVRRAAAGVYTWLPLGLRVLANVSRVVREEMDRIGGQEVLFSALVPREHYQATGRLAEYGDLLFSVRDRRGVDFVLGPTHEEMFSLLVAAEVSSYRELPLILYQVQHKYRDEARPRSGVLRGREFLMKDSYSFDLDDAGLASSYRAHRDAYRRICDRLGLEYRIVRAQSGAMGGSHSEEFLAPSPSGEDTFVWCPECDYAANTEAATIAPPATADPVRVDPAETLHTPGAPGIGDLVRYFDAHLGGGIGARDILKCVVFGVDGAPVVVLVPGDREVDTDRLAAALAPAKVTVFGPEDFAARPDLVRGYVGPQGMAGRGVPVYADQRVASGSAWVTGANRYEHHARGVVAGRDFDVDRVLDVVRPQPDEPCPTCGAALRVDRAIEVGHIFQLGRKYADVFGLDVLGPDGRPVRVTMGCYGIGVSRLVAAVAEQSHDERGLAWPEEVAPYHVHLVALGRAGQAAQAVALGERLEAAGLRVLVDDRIASPGVKLTDAELIGVPHIVVVGRRAAEGVVEVRDRRSGTARELPADKVLAAITRKQD